jgi:hypothetical protein
MGDLKREDIQLGDTYLLDAIEAIAKDEIGNALDRVLEVLHIFTATERGGRREVNFHDLENSIRRAANELKRRPVVDSG